MDTVHFLNLEYFLVLIYRLFTGSNVDISEIPKQTLSIMQDIAWAGLALSLFFLALFIYERVKMHEVEHAGWHHRSEMMQELARRHTVHAAKNPQWEQVKMLMGSPSENDWRRAIMEADIMLDEMLTVQGYHGAGVGDKLRSVEPSDFDSLHDAWQAHDVRNQIAHQGSAYDLSQQLAQRTIGRYERVFTEFQGI